MSGLVEMAFPVRLLLIASVITMSAPALAQQQPAQPTPNALVASLHQQLVDSTDQLTLANARLWDAMDQITKLQATIDAMNKKATPSVAPAAPQTK